MTSVELLERAAKVLRDHAWGAIAEINELIEEVRSIGWDDYMTNLVDGEEPDRSAIGEYAARMHPPVALALADLLTVLSWMPSSADPTDMHAATKLARAILREPEPEVVAP